MRACILGAGASGLLHALSLRAHGVRVEAVFDPNRARAESLAELCGGGVAADLDAIDRAAPDIVAICGPPRVHADQAVRFAREERILFVEKPIATTEPDLRSLEKLEGCVPVLQWRFGRALRAIRRAIQWGELGPRPTVNVDLAWSRDGDYFANGRGSRSAWGCGALLSIGIHAVDAVLFALGRDVQEVAGALVEPPSFDVETGASMMITTTNGALVTLRLSLDAACDVTRMTFCGRGVTASIVGTEEDPTASNVVWSCRDARVEARLRKLEADEPGFTHGPLLVPLIGAALGRLTTRPMGRGPEELVPASVRSTTSAHRAIFTLYRAAVRRAPASHPTLHEAANGVGRR